MNSLASHRAGLSPSFFRNVLNTDLCLHSLLPPPRSAADTSKLGSSQTSPKVHTHTVLLFFRIQYGLNHYQHKINKSVLILVLLLVSFIAVMFDVGCLISVTHLCFIAFLSLYVRIDVLIYSAAQLQECLINLLTYLLNRKSRLLYSRPGCTICLDTPVCIPDPACIRTSKPARLAFQEFAVY